MSTFLQGRAKKAHEQPKHRFDNLDELLNEPFLKECWRDIRKEAASGVDRMSAQDYERHLDENIHNLVERLKRKQYRAKLVRRQYIPKGDGKLRPLGIPAVEDKLLQLAVTRILQAIYEQDFLRCSYGYRPHVGALDAVDRLTIKLQFGRYNFVVEADIKGFFDTIAQEQLIDLIAEEISDGRVLQLVRDMLRAGVWEEGRWAPTETGVPQGGVASPLWSNIFLTPFDRWMRAQGFRLTRWADDFVVVCRTKAEAQRALASAERFLREEVGVALHPQKTRIVHVRQGVEFLGDKIKRGKGFRLPAPKRRSQANPHDLSAIPRPKSLKRFQERIRNLTRRKAPITLPELIERINPVIRGWGTYYRKAHVRGLFNRLDRWMERRIYSFLAKRWRNTMWRKYPKLIEEYGLVRLTHLLPGLVQG